MSRTPRIQLHEQADLVTDSPHKIRLSELDGSYEGLVTEIIELYPEGTSIRGVNVFIPSVVVKDVLKS